MNADGTHLKRLTTNPAVDEQPQWSPDGTHIAFTSTRTPTTAQVFVMKADGTHERQLTSIGENALPSWSPSGKQIVFTSSRDGNSEIYKRKADGSVINLTNNPADDAYPAYSPNGKWIAFESFRDGNFEIYKMSSSGGQQTNLTNDPLFNDVEPTWQPLH